jgi:sugar O-acyltransferase (sialic acid O-acetyltransferase NeuD family)
MKIAVIGAGGFAREIAWLISDITNTQRLADLENSYEFAGYLVSDAGKLGPRDTPTILGDFNWLKENEIDALALGVGDPTTRMRLAEELSSAHPKLEWPALVHPTVQHDETCRFGAGATLSAGTIATVNVEVGAFAMVNLTCTIGHETVIGEGSVINPLTAISGGVKIGKRVLVGTHASILQYVEIGNDAVIGAGAMVNKFVAAGATVMGVPAKAKGGGSSTG